MIIYNVTVNIDFSSHDEWLDWMKSKHIPDVMATGKFIEAKIAKVLAEDEGGVTYAIQYLCESMETLDAYQETHAPKLQKEHTEKFQGKFVAFRTLLQVTEHFLK